MRIKKWLLCTLPLALIAFVFAFGGSLVHSPEAEASGPMCSPYGFRQVHGWAAGATCAAARQACAVDVWNSADAYCGARDVCESQPISHGACLPSGNEFHQDCTMMIKCTLAF